jgi:hypothetical protein
MRISNLSDVDGDEVSLVRRAANRRRFLLLKGSDEMDSELSDILDVPWEREGAMLDELRKDGITDETVEKAFVTAVRLLKGIEGEFSPELVEKLGREMYPTQNPALNSGSVKSPGELSGSASGDEEDLDATATDGELDGESDTTYSLTGSASGDKVAADNWNDGDEDDMGKADFSDDERKGLASRGQALPDGSYPIRNKSDLSNAIQAYGRAKDKGRAKAWIIRRAKALGATGMLPDSWSVSKSDDEKEETVEFRTPVQKEDGTWDYTDVPEESHSFFKMMIEKAEQAEAVQKSLDETKIELRKAQDTISEKEFVAKADEFDKLAPASKLGLVLKNAAESMDAEQYENLVTVLKAAQARVDTGDLFKELGARALEDADSIVAKSDPYSQIEALADQMVEKSGDLTREQAIERVLKTEKGKELYARYENEYLGQAALSAGFGGVN